MGELMDLFAEPVLAVYGNHDVSENTISQHDTLSVLVRAGRLRLLDESFAWRGEMNGVNVLLGGTPWGRRLPKKVDPGEHDLAVWIAHHDVMMPGYEEVGRFPPREIAGVDLVINGHIHRRLQDVRKGATCWINPGNITRRKRSDASRAHTPAALRIDIAPAKSPADRWGQQYIEIPHEPFDEVFHPQVMTAEGEAIESQFVAGLAELQARRTATSAGLVEFLEHNRGQFAPAVGDEIMALAQEVTGNGD
jgi:predicted phosphodiesterase